MPLKQLRALDFRWMVALASVYLVWGSTYLAIKVAVETIPPLLAAGTRFLIAGAILYAWARLRNEAPPQREQWPRLWLLGGLMFVMVYSCLFWAEKSVPSGVASVLVATLPAWVLILEILILKTQRVTVILLFALALGLMGVLLLTGGIGRTPLHWIPCAAIVLSEFSWALGSVLSKRMRLPGSHGITAGAQMLCGGILLLACSGLFGEWRNLQRPSTPAIVAMAYMIVAGSLVAFSSYVWLLERMSPTKLVSYAYVNPVVALLLGWLAGGEHLTGTTLAGSALVLASVILILTRRAVPPEPTPAKYVAETVEVARRTS